MTAGYFTLYAGVIMFFIGIIALVYYCWLALRNHDLPRRRVWISMIGGIGLLLSNFPVAGGITVAAIAIESRYTVIIHNDSQQPLNGVRVYGGGRTSFDSIPPGCVVQRSFWIQHRGELQFLAISGTTTLEKTIDGYVTDGMRGCSTVTVNPDNTISVSNRID